MIRACNYRITASVIIELYRTTLEYRATPLLSWRRGHLMASRIIPYAGRQQIWGWP